MHLADIGDSLPNFIISLMKSRRFRIPLMAKSKSSA